MFDGKWVWIWNWRRCDGGDATRVAQRLKAAGCCGALVKAHDGPYWFDQGQPWREICRALKSFGLRVAGWAYLYGRDWQAEARRAIDTIHYGEADGYVMDVESEFKDRPDVAEALCQRLREGVGQGFPLFYSTFAIARYHQRFPYAAFERHCSGTLPQVYWNAFRWPVEQALDWMYEDYASLGIAADRVLPVAGAYAQGFVAYPSAEELQRFAQMAGERGSRGVSFWSYEHMDDIRWQAVEGIPWPGRTDEIEELRQEMARLRRQNQELGRQNVEFAGRIGRGMELAREMLKVLMGET
jgi:hypothetical protein